MNTPADPGGGPQALAPLASRAFDQKLASSFYQKSVSEETRRAYRRVVTEFFKCLGGLHPTLVTAGHVLDWRDSLIRRRKRAATIAFSLSVVRSFFEYLRAGGVIANNPASTRLVPPPAVPSEPSGRALTSKEVRGLLAGPDRRNAEGARDYALMLLMLRLGLRVSEACSLKVSSIKWSHGRWIVKFKIKGGRERTLPLPSEVKKTIDDYLTLDAGRRKKLLSDGENAFIFQPHSNYRTLVFDKGISVRAVWNIVSRWGDYGGIGKTSPHDLRRTAITRALNQGMSYRQVQMMSGHRDPKTVMRYDHGRENLDNNAVNFLKYDDE